MNSQFSLTLKNVTNKCQEGNAKNSRRTPHPSAVKFNRGEVAIYLHTNLLDIETEAVTAYSAAIE